MPPSPALKPASSPVRNYCLALAQFANVGARHEGTVRSAFDQLIEACAGPLKWTLVREYELRRKAGSSLRLDGALLDQYRLVHGCLESKDDAVGAQSCCVPLEGATRSRPYLRLRRSRAGPFVPAWWQP